MYKKDVGKLIIISGPPAGGKDAVRREMVARGYSIIVTTTSRPPRPDDLSGDYEYVSVPEFDQMVAQGVFADVSPVMKGYRYGTRKSELLKSLKKSVVWRIDPTSASNAREIVGNAFKSEQDVCAQMVEKIKTFWVMAESAQELERRLEIRDGHTGPLLEKAKAQVKLEMDFFEANREKYDHVIINQRDHLKEAVDEIESKLN